MKIKKNEQGKIYFEFEDYLDYIYFYLVERRFPQLTFTHQSMVTSEMDNTEQELIDGMKDAYNVDIVSTRGTHKYGAKKSGVYKFIIKLKDKTL